MVFYSFVKIVPRVFDLFHEFSLDFCMVFYVFKDVLRVWVFSWGLPWRLLQNYRGFWEFPKLKAG